MLPIRPVRTLKRYEEHVEYYRYALQSRKQRKDKEQGNSGSNLKQPTSAFPYAREADLAAAEQFAKAIAYVLYHAAALKQELEALSESNPNSVINKRLVILEHPQLVAAEALPGAKPAELTLEIRSLAQTQINQSALFVPDAPSSVGPGLARIRLVCGSSAKELKLHLLPGDTHRRVLTRLREAINQTSIGVNATLETNPGSNRIRLVLESSATGRHAGFSLEDLEGSLAASSGLLVKDRASADAEYRVSTTPWSSSPTNIILLETYGIRIELLQRTYTPVQLHIVRDPELLSQHLKRLEAAIQKLQAELEQQQEYINPTYIHMLEPVTSKLRFHQLQDLLHKDPEAAAAAIGGKDGWISHLLHLIQLLETSPAEDLINRSSSRYKRYANYLSNLDWYSQLPPQGLLLNRFL